ncbi:hypothetical protein [Caulobacter hibisci]|uniref:Uncharacterized protein n=1 Tax=Caulobacter hibisci TaxID=2035993 RepID=A0ABS0SX70_9CAUL|nr:hypothetical protein [Caulobacter hibisci]MBI1684199.1 hypothetical protein [Caulobacter hibisci]
MAMDDEAEALLGRIRAVRADLEAGRLTPDQVRLYRRLGRNVERITRWMDDAPDSQAAEALWAQGAQIIAAFLDEHFPLPTRH